MAAHSDHVKHHNRICVPGEHLGLESEYHTGPGTYRRNGSIYASLAGHLCSRTEVETELPALTVLQQEIQITVPRQKSLVTCKVVSITSKFCRCDILSVESVPLTETFRGMIRKEDIRATEKDKVEVYKSFRPGDIVLARVLSLGDAQSYLLTTAENELGVVLAKSEAGVPMVPTSWCEMTCPKTHDKQLRKVAKVQPHYIAYAS
ncbi:exosome complex component CSL4 [Strongylocentrotus purpuratus]|uniref:Exosome complex component CSL4 n=1 Tax=Strongylocentrotus purpuratus TaxID=7668 RepID=A0A7M7NZL7_STRPU|nr:exosome complex component CSL4 [Strongylocentrotus purpuratus]